MSQTILDLEKNLQWLAENNDKPGVPEYAYVEVGRYKPYHPSIVAAAKRRGYRVEKLSQSAYAVYPKPAEGEQPSEALPLLEFSLSLTGSVAPDGGDPSQRAEAISASTLERNLMSLVERALENGQLTSETPAILEEHEARVVVLEAGEDYAPAPGLKVVAEIKSARPLEFGHVDIRSGDQLCRLDDAVAATRAVAVGDWISGVPSSAVEVAWLRVVHETVDGPVENTVLGICDPDGAWRLANRWQADDALDQVEGEITHWMPYIIPSPRLEVAARSEKPLAQLRAEVEAGLAELLRRADEPLAINYGQGVYLEACPPLHYGERVAVCHREFGWTCVNYTSEGLILDVFDREGDEPVGSMTFLADDLLAESQDSD